MRHAYRHPIRKLHEPPVDGEWLWSWIAAVIDLPGFVYWRVREWLGLSKTPDDLEDAICQAIDCWHRKHPDLMVSEILHALEAIRHDLTEVVIKHG